MHLDFKQAVRITAACVLATFFAVPQSLKAEAIAAHVVSTADLQKAAVAATQTREQNLKTVQAFVSSEKAVKAMKDAHLDPQQVKTAVASLNDAELAQLAARADKAQANFAAGDLSDRDLIWIIVGIAALILIIVAVR
jgi:predicted NAD/FAD-binding protein